MNWEIILNVMAGMFFFEVLIGFLFAWIMPE